MTALKLSLPMADFEALHQQADTRRRKVSIDRQALALLLIDHARLAAVAQEDGHDIINPNQ